MKLTAAIAKQFRDVHSGGNWTSVNLRDTLTGVSREMAVTKIHFLNSIAVLIYHISYYYSAVIKVLEGGPLDAKDKYSFELPPIESEAAWNNMKEKCSLKQKNLRG